MYENWMRARKGYYLWHMKTKTKKNINFSILFPYLFGRSQTESKKNSIVGRNDVVMSTRVANPFIKINCNNTLTATNFSFLKHKDCREQTVERQKFSCLNCFIQSAQIQPQPVRQRGEWGKYETTTKLFRFRTFSSTQLCSTSFEFCRSSYGNLIASPPFTCYHHL